MSEKQRIVLSAFISSTNESIWSSAILALVIALAAIMPVSTAPVWIVDVPVTLPVPSNEADVQTTSPVIPTVLINGAQGIGTGYSTTIPNFNPLDIIKCLEYKLDKKPFPEIKPWYNGFKGTIEKVNDKQYISRGKYRKISSSCLKITELPIGTWTEDYKNFLETLIIDKSKPNKKQTIVHYEDNSTECDVDFTLKFQPVTLMRLLKHNPDKNGIPHMVFIMSTQHTCW